jgi:hypothetical protein
VAGDVEAEAGEGHGEELREEGGAGAEGALEGVVAEAAVRADQAREAGATDAERVVQPRHLRLERLRGGRVVCSA